MPEDHARPASGAGGIPGAATLVAVAVILALAAFASMCLSTASADQKILFRMLDADDAWHEADAEAMRTLARLRSGEIPEGVSRNGNAYAYETEIDASRSLYVEAEIEDDGSYRILSWRTARSSEWTPDQSLHVIGGD